MSDDMPQEREVKDFYFKTQGKVRVNASPSSLQCSRCSLLAVSNKYGFVFAGTTDGFKVLRQADLSQRLQGVDKMAAVVEDFPFWAYVGLGQAPTHVAVSADDHTLAVCIVKGGCPFALMYDVRAFSNKDAGVAPFLEVRLSATGGAEVLDLAWNPGAEFAAILASCTSDGSLNLWEIGEGLRVVASLPPAIGAQALCWSPKGKQLVVGKKDGKLMQFDQQLRPKKEIPGPPEFGPGSMSVVDLFWQSTHVFVAAYGHASGDTSEPPNVVIINVPKGENPNYAYFGDICYGSGEDRKHKYYMLQIVEWDMICHASANALEAAVMGRHPELKTLWERWSLEDAGRAEMPLTEDYSETMPTGMVLSLTSQTQIPIGENNVLPPSPLFLMLSTDGLLISFHMINTRPGMPSLNRAPEPLSAAGVRASKPGLAPTQPTAPAPSAVAPNPGSVAKTLFPPAQPGGSIQASLAAPAAPSASKPSIFSSIALGQNTSTPAKGFTFGGAPAQPSAPQPITAVAKPASTIPAQPAPSAPTSSPFGLVSSSATSFSFNRALDQSSTASQPIGAPTQSSGFGSFTPASSQGQPPPGLFGGKPTASLGVPQTSGPPPTSASPKPGGALFGALSSGSTEDRPQSFSFKPAATPSVSAAPVSVVKPSPTPPVMSIAASQQPATAPTAQPAATVKTAPPPMPVSSPGAPKTSSAFSVSQSAAGAKRSQMPSGVVTPQQPTATIQQPLPSPQARPTLKPQTRRSLETPANTVDNPFVKSILDEMMHFNSELKDLFARCKSVNTHEVGTEREKEQLRAGTEHMVSFCSEIKDTMQSLNSDVTHLKSQSLEGFALLEECQVRDRQGTEPAYQHLLRSRALDPASARLMKSVHSQYQYLDSSIRAVDLRLDAEWEEYQRTKNKARVIRTPASDALYQTLRNNNNVLNSQSHSIDRLISDLQEMRLYNTTSTWQASPTIHALSERGDGSFSERLLSPSPAVSQPSPVTASPISPEKQAKLREVLSKRRVTPVKSTAPGNLSMSKIVSATSLRRILAGDEDEVAPTPVATPPRLSSAPPKTVQVSPQPQQMMASSAKSPVGMKPTATPGLVGLLQSPNSAMKPISKPPISAISANPTVVTATASKPLPSGITSTKPTLTPNTTLPMEGGKPNLASMGFSALMPPGGINMSQPPPFSGVAMAGSRVKVTQERPSDPAAKVISQNAEGGGSAFPSVSSAKTSDAGSFGTGGFGFPASGAASSTSGPVPAPPFSFMKPSSTSFSFNAASSATTSKPTPGYSFSGASAAPISAPVASTGSMVRFSDPPVSGGVNGLSGTSGSSATIGSNSSATIASSLDSSSVPSLLEADYVFQPETEEWEIVTKVSVELSERRTGYDEVTPPGTPPPPSFTVRSSDADTPAAAEVGAGDKGPPPGMFSFNQAAKEGTPPSSLFSGAGAAAGQKKTTDLPSTTKTILGGSLPSLGGGAGFTFGAAAGSTPSVQTTQKKDGEAGSSSGSAPTSGLFGKTTTASSGFTFGAPGTAGGAGSGTFTFGGAGPSAPTSTSTFGGAASTSKPLFGGVSTSAPATAAPTFGATVVSGAGSASSAAPNVPASSWKPIVSANSSITGSLTSGTPVFGSAAAASAPSTAVTTAPPAAPSIAAAADTTSTQSTTPQPSDGAASEAAAAPEKSAVSSTTSAAKQLFGQAAESAPATAPAPAPSVVKSLFGQAATSSTSSSAFGAAGLSLKPVTTPASSTSATVGAGTSAVGASESPQPAVVSVPASVGPAGGAAAVAAPPAIATTLSTTTSTTSTLFGKPTTGLFGSAASSTAAASSTTTTSATSTTPSIFGTQATPSTTATTGTGLFGATSSMFGTKPAVAATTSEAPASSAAKSLFGNTQTATTATPLFGGSQPATTAATTGTGLFGSAQAAPAAPASSSGSIFGQSAVFGSTAPTAPPAFGGVTSTSGSGAGFGQSSAPGFGSAPFGQKPSAVFGGQPSQPLFGGQTATTTSSPSGFGQPAVPSSGNGAFGGGGGGGGGGFFSGLGGKPSAENANKNVFGSTTFGTATSAGGSTTGLFGSSTSPSVSSFGGGAFSTGVSQSGSVAASGFGGFSSPPPQQAAAPQRGGFGGAPAFGGSPSFGSPPAFGSTPGFGSGAAFSNPMGQSPAAPATGGFASFAGSSAPTFGGIAQHTGPSFGDMSGQGGAATFGSPQPGFGSPAPAGGVFGGGAGGSAPSFGGGSSSFGASPSFGGGPSSPSFTSYRS